MKRSLELASAAFLVASLASALQSPVARHEVTFNDIAPILYHRCAACHHPGGSGPFSLLAYRDARKRAAQIAAVTKSRFMPPWLPEPGYGHFADEQRLTGQQIRLIQEWSAQGAPEGKSGDLPPKPGFSGAWELGKPDLVLELPRPYILPAAGDNGRDIFRNFVVRVPVETTRYVRAIELRPSNPKIFHHANILVDRSGTSRGREREPGAGFEGMDLEIESESFDPDGYFLSWKPGSPPVPGSAGMSWRVDPGTDLVLNLHMRPDGKPEAIQVSLGLYFAPEPPTRFPMLLQLARDNAIDIPPGDNNFAVRDDFTLPLDVEVLAVYPHAHYLGKHLQGYAMLPDGTRKWLIRIGDWNLDWQGVFRYAEPLFLPKGTTVHMQWTYDNSSANVRNPNSPPRRVVAGNRATDEMSHLWLQVLPVSDSRLKVDPRLILEEAFMRHRAGSDPTDYIARYNLGSALQIMGKLDESAQEYRGVLSLRPDDPVARNSLGTVLQLQGKTDEAIQEYRKVLQVTPGYSDAEYNLGRAHLAQGKLEEAVFCFEAVLRVHPNHANAHHSIGLVFQLQGKTEEAIHEYREVLRLQPGYTDAEYNLGRALLVQGKTQPAIDSFNAVLRAHPQDPDVHHSLGLALAELGDVGQAQREIEQAVRLKPDDVESHNDLGMLLARQGKMGEAAIEFREALRLDPHDPDAHDNLGRILMEQGNLTSAVSEIQESLRLRPQNADAHNDLGIVLARQGDLAQAKAQFEEALRINPDMQTAKDNLRRLQIGLNKKK
jgi:tetratricopeptide (TPR) repeat protein